MTNITLRTNPSALAGSAIEDILFQLREDREETHNIRRDRQIRQMPSRAVIATVVDQLATVLFPTHYGSLDLAEGNVDTFVAGILNHALLALTRQVRLDLSLDPDRADQGGEAIVATAEQTVAEFAKQLPGIRGTLVGDLKAAHDGDPAATSYPEILLAYPGTIAIIYHRLAHALFRLGATLTARLIAQIAHSKTAIDIHPSAEIGASLFMDHGTGIVIGETARIGARVTLHQGVTLGAWSGPAEWNGAVIKGAPRHPIVEDDVVIHAGAAVLGRITIGHGSVIGGNVWLTQSVPPGSNIRQAPLRED